MCPCLGIRVSEMGLSNPSGSSETIGNVTLTLLMTVMRTPPSTEGARSPPGDVPAVGPGAGTAPGWLQMPALDLGPPEQPVPAIPAAVAPR